VTTDEDRVFRGVSSLLFITERDVTQQSCREVAVCRKGSHVLQPNEISCLICCCFNLLCFIARV